MDADLKQKRDAIAQRHSSAIEASKQLTDYANSDPTAPDVLERLAEAAKGESLIAFYKRHLDEVNAEQARRDAERSAAASKLAAEEQAKAQKAALAEGEERSAKLRADTLEFEKLASAESMAIAACYERAGLVRGLHTNAFNDPMSWGTPGNFFVVAARLPEVVALRAPSPEQLERAYVSNPEARPPDAGVFSSYKPKPPPAPKRSAKVRRSAKKAAGAQ